MPDLVHCARISLAVGETVWQVAEDGLVAKSGPGSKVIPYTSINTVRLITYAGAGGTHGRVTLTTSGHGKHKIGSHHYVSLGNLENRAASYVPFVRALARRTADANPHARFVAGSMGLWLGWLFVCLLLLSLAALVAAVALEDAPPWLRLIGPVVLLVAMGPFALRWAIRNLPHPFDPKSIPTDLLL